MERNETLQYDAFSADAAPIESFSGGCLYVASQIMLRTAEPGPRGNSAFCDYPHASRFVSNEYS
jgi:hypothetical protein